MSIAVAITSVIGDDVVLTGRLPPVDQWRDEVVFGTIAVAVGLLVSAKRKQQLKAERLAMEEVLRGLVPYEIPSPKPREREARE